MEKITNAQRLQAIKDWQRQLFNDRDRPIYEKKTEFGIVLRSKIGDLINVALQGHSQEFRLEVEQLKSEIGLLLDRSKLHPGSERYCIITVLYSPLRIAKDVDFIVDQLGARDESTIFDALRGTKRLSQARRVLKWAMNSDVETQRNILATIGSIHEIELTDFMIEAVLEYVEKCALNNPVPRFLNWLIYERMIVVGMYRRLLQHFRIMVKPGNMVAPCVLRHISDCPVWYAMIHSVELDDSTLYRGIRNILDRLFGRRSVETRIVRWNFFYPKLNSTILFDLLEGSESDNHLGALLAQTIDLTYFVLIVRLYERQRKFIPPAIKNLITYKDHNIAANAIISHLSRVLPKDLVYLVISYVVAG